MSMSVPRPQDVPVITNGRGADSLLVSNEKTGLTAPWFCATYGYQFDLIALDHRPRTEQEREWVAHLRTRLRPGGALVQPQDDSTIPGDAMLMLSHGARRAVERPSPPVSASRAALIAVLTQHVMDPESGDCWGHDKRCGWAWTAGGPIDQHARHQADALAAAGIHPFRAIDPVEQT